MFAEVLQDVDESVPDLARRPERSRMKAIRPDLAVAPERAIDRLRDADGETLHAATERDDAVAFDEEMDVIPLDAEVYDPEPSSRCSRERRSDGTEDVVAPQGRQLSLARSVTWTGQRGSCTARRRWGARRRPGAGLRPAPFRRPPHVGGDVSSSCRGVRILNRHILHQAC